jgi:hypothetical protein
MLLRSLIGNRIYLWATSYIWLAVLGVGGQDQARDAGLRGSLQGTAVQGYRPAGELLGEDHLVGQGDHPLDGRELCQDPDTANLIEN